MGKPGTAGMGGQLAICGALLVALLAGWTGCSAAGQAAQKDAKALQEFNKRVQAYADLHKRIAGSFAPIPQSADSAILVKRQQEFAAKMSEARAGAVRGDIFIPDAQPLFRAIIKEALSGQSAGQVREVILGEGNPRSAASPANVVLKVNTSYPSAAPLSTVPPFLLLRVPKLPEQLDYRFVGRTLILRDTIANMIVDFLPEAVPAK